MNRPQFRNSKEDGIDQESSTTPDPGHRRGK